MAKTIKTFVNTGNEETNQLVDVVQGSGDKGKPTRIKAIKGARYQLQDPANKDAGPEQVRSKRVGKNLHVILGDGTDADLIVENYYEENKTTDGSSGLFGRAEDGGLYEYIPEDPIEAGTVANLKDGGSAVSQVLGGGVLADEFVLSALPIVAAGISPLAVAGGAAAAAAAGGGGGGVTPTPVVIPSTPAVPGITDNAGAHIGPLVDGELTDDTKPVFSGKGTAGNTIKVYDGTTVIATTTVKSDGTWSVQPTEPLKNTAHSISTTESNAAGESAKSPVFNILVGKPLPPVAGEIIDNVGETQANLKTGDETDDTTPTFNGKGKPGDIVTLYDGDKVVATTTVNTDGTWSITPQNELGGGTHTLTLTESNALGESEKSSPVTLKIVTTGPATPRALKVTDNVGDIVGEVQPNGDTDDNKPEISGMGTPGTKVKVMDGVKELGTVDVKADGTWTLTPTDALSEGAHSITTVTVDAAGKQSVPTGAYVINVDTIAPAKPSLPAATDNVGTATGAIVNGTTTDDASPDFSGTGIPGDKIRVLDGTTLLGEATVGTDGKWNFTPTKPLGNGAHSITLVEIDPAGNKSEPSPALTFNVDASAVTVAITKVLDNQGAVTADVSNNGVTDDVSPTLIGTATKNAVVTIKEGTTELGKVTADADGNWSFTPTAVQTEGKHTYTAEVTTAGATQTSSIVITVDTTAPAVPAAAITDNVGPQQGALVNGSSTDDTTPVFSGVGTPGDTIKLYDGDKVVGSTTVKPDGTWSLKPEAAKPLAEGPHALSVTATDPAGNESAKSPTTNIVVDTSAPNGGNAPLLSITTDGDNSGTVDGKELGTSETFAIKAEFDKTKVAVGDRLVVSDGVTTKVVTLTQQDIDKGFATTTFAKPAEGATLTVTAALLDATGNTTAKATDSAKLDTATLDPATPRALKVTDNVGDIVGEVQPNGDTDDNKPEISGMGTPGTKVKVMDGVKELGTVDVKADGTWTLTPTDALSEGAHSITTVTVDAAGKQSVPTGAYVINVDTIAPAKPSLPAATDNVGTATGAIVNGTTTDDASPDFSGTGIPGDKIRVLDGTTLLGEATVGTDGKWNFTPTKPLGNGAHSITLVEIDPAGNKSEPSPALTFNVDASAVTVAITKVLDNQGAVTADVSNNGVTDDVSPTLIGTATKNAVVTIKEGTTELGKVTADADGNWSFTPTAVQTEGKHTYTAEVTTAGATQTSSIVITVDTTAPAVPAAAITDNVGPQQGALVNGSSTDDTTPVFSGVGTPGDTIKLYDGDKVVGSTTVKPDGTWSLKPEAAKPLAEGPHALSVTATDPAGNESAKSPTTNIVVDTSAPNGGNAPLLSITTDGDNSGTVDGKELGTSETFAIKAEFDKTKVAVGDRLVVSDGVTTKVVTLTQQDIDKGFATTTFAKPAEGATLTVTAALLDATGNTTAKATDSAKLDTSGSSLNKTATIDIVAITEDSGVSASDFVTNDKSLTYSGTVSGFKANGDKVKVELLNAKGEVLETAYVDVTGASATTAGAGAWSWVRATEHADGKYTVRATIVDASGNRVNTTVPVNGTGGGQDEQVVVVDTSGGNNVDPTDPVDPIKPDANTSATIDIVAITEDSGVSASDFVTNDKSLTYSGTVSGFKANGDKVKVELLNAKGEVLETAYVDVTGASATTAGAGAWSWVRATEHADGKYTVRATIVDASGNRVNTTVPVNGTGGGQDEQVVVVDTSGGNNVDPTDPVDPIKPDANTSATIDIVAITEDSGVSASDFVTNDKSLTYSGTVSGFKANGDKVKVELLNAKGEVLETAYVDVTGASATTAGAGAWSWVRATEHADGKYTVRATIVDASGNRVNTTVPVNGTGGGQDEQVVVVDTSGGNNVDPTDPVDPIKPDANTSATIDIVAITEDSGVSASDFVTNDKSLTYSGTVSGFKANGDKVKVELLNAKGEVLETAYVDVTGASATTAGAGAWSWVRATEHADGKYTVRATIVDASGNRVNTTVPVNGTGGGQDEQVVVVDTSGGNNVDPTDPVDPIKPDANTSATIDIVAITEDSGVSASDFVTNDKSLTYSGTVSGFKANGDKVKVELLNAKGEVLETAYVDVTGASATTAGAGAWSWVRATEHADGKYTVRATIVDASGNRVNTTVPVNGTGGGQDEQVVVVDTSGGNNVDPTDPVDPIKPDANTSATIDIVAITEDSGVSASDFVTNDKSLTYSGTVSGFKANGDKVKVELLNAKGEVLETAYVDVTGASATTAGAGAWSWVRATEHADGKYTVRATIVDASGNRVNTTVPVNGTGGGQDEQVVVVDTADRTNAKVGLSVSITDDVTTPTSMANDGWINKSELGSRTELISKATFNTSAKSGDKIVFTATNDGTALTSQTVTLTDSDIANKFVSVKFAVPAEGKVQAVTANYVSISNGVAIDAKPSDSITLDTIAANAGTITGLVPANEYATYTDANPLKMYVALPANLVVGDVITLKMFNTKFSTGGSSLVFEKSLIITDSDLSSTTKQFDVPGSKFDIKYQPSFTAQIKDLAGNVGELGYSADAAPRITSLVVADDFLFDQQQKIQSDAVREEFGGDSSVSVGYDNATVDDTLKLTMSANPLTKIHVFDKTIGEIGNAIAGAEGASGTGLASVEWTSNALANGKHELTIKSETNGVFSFASETFTVVIQEKVQLNLDLATVNSEGGKTFDGTVVSETGGTAQRFTISLDALLAVASKTPLTFNGDDTDTLVVTDAFLFFNLQEQPDVAVHDELAGYWKFDLNQDGKFDLLVQDTIHRIAI